MEYNFPDEIFNIFFPISIQVIKNYHYKAMIDQDDFYFLTQRHKNKGLSYYYNLRFYDSGNLTYYLKIVLNSGRNSDAKNIVRFRKKGVAAKNIKSDFINIYKEYGDNKYLNGVIKIYS